MPTQISKLSHGKLGGLARLKFSDTNSTNGRVSDQKSLAGQHSFSSLVKEQGFALRRIHRSFRFAKRAIGSLRKIAKRRWKGTLLRQQEKTNRKFKVLFRFLIEEIVQFSDQNLLSSLPSLTWSKTRKSLLGFCQSLIARFTTWRAPLALRGGPCRDRRVLRSFSEGGNRPCRGGPEGSRTLDLCIANAAL